MRATSSWVIVGIAAFGVEALCAGTMNTRKAHEWGDEYEVLPGLSIAEESNLEAKEYNRIRQEQGLNAALDWRQSRFIEEDSWWIERQKARKP